jgi:hypothetical protein
LERGLKSLELDPPRCKSIVHWPWIINALLN